LKIVITEILKKQIKIQKNLFIKKSELLKNKKVMDLIKNEEMKILKEILKNLLQKIRVMKEQILDLKLDEKIIIEDKILDKIKKDELGKGMIIKKVL
jgi:hypothetical protein